MTKYFCTCGNEICKETARHNGMCHKCAGNNLNNKGINSTSYKGGYKNKNGYLLTRVANHPNATNKGYVFAHRFVVEEIVGRYLKSTEIVHHLNGIRADNRPENLQLTARKGHSTWTLLQLSQQRIRDLEKR